MLQKRKKIIAIIINLSTVYCTAQSVILSSGGNAIGSGGFAGYSIGQVSYIALSTSYGSVEQGIQQTYTMPEITVLEENEAEKVSFSVYPNPTTEKLTIELKNPVQSTLSYQLIDIQGKLLQKGKISGSQTNINLSNLRPDIYFIIINNNHKKIQSIKIIKK